MITLWIDGPRGQMGTPSERRHAVNPPAHVVAGSLRHQQDRDIRELFQGSPVAWARNLAEQVHGTLRSVRHCQQAADAAEQASEAAEIALAQRDAARVHEAEQA